MAAIAAGVLDTTVFGMAPEQYGPMALIVTLGLLLPNWAVTVRRLHDSNRSGWWLLIGLVPILGWIVLLVFYLSRGTPAPNRFG